MTRWPPAPSDHDVERSDHPRCGCIPPGRAAARRGQVSPSSPTRPVTPVRAAHKEPAQKGRVFRPWPTSPSPAQSAVRLMSSPPTSPGSGAGARYARRCFGFPPKRRGSRVHPRRPTGPRRLLLSVPRRRSPLVRPLLLRRRHPIGRARRRHGIHHLRLRRGRSPRSTRGRSSSTVPPAVTATVWIPG